MVRSCSTIVPVAREWWQRPAPLTGTSVCINWRARSRSLLFSGKQMMGTTSRNESDERTRAVRRENSSIVGGGRRSTAARRGGGQGTAYRPESSGLATAHAGRSSSYFDKVHRDHGLKSHEDIARAMNLRAKSRVNTLLRGTLPADEEQAKALIRALGGSAGDATVWREPLPHDPVITCRGGIAQGPGQGGPRGRGTPRRAATGWRQSAFQRAYLWQVQQFAPLNLAGRDVELEELARFCLIPTARLMRGGRPSRGQASQRCWLPSSSARRRKWRSGSR